MTLEEILNNVINPTNRLFGVEIEVNNLSPSNAQNVLRQININSRVEDYNHSRRTWWKITRDGSLSGGSNSCEIVSPPLPFNKDSLKLVAAIIEAIRVGGGAVDSTCGLHVHVDARNITARMDKFSRILFLKYRENESIIDRLVNSNRRGNANRFCMSLQNLERNTVYATLRRDRYYKLNFASFERHGTIEFRQHEGCLNEKKVVAWIIFCVGFFESTLQFFNSQNQTQIDEILSGVSSWA
jgi:hypothetical protein